MQASDRVNVTHAELEDVPSNGTTSLVLLLRPSHR
jgi:hypothetical protein